MSFFRSRSRDALLSASLLLSVNGCKDGRGESRAIPALLPSIDQVVAWQREVRLEENSKAINVSPRFAVEPGGGLLVSDGQEQQLRFYAPDGRLRGTFGRRGSGPGEFQNLARAVRLKDGSILAADFMGKLTRFDAAGARVLGISMSGIGPIYQLVVLDDSVVAVIGRMGGRAETPLVHLWNVTTGRVSRSFFPAPQGPPGFAAGYAFTGFVDDAVRGDTLAVLFALQDTLHLFLRSGRPVARIPIPFHAFRRMKDPPPPGMGEDLRKWMDSYSVVNRLFWLGDGSFLVQQMDQEGSDRRYSLLLLARDAKVGWQVTDSPELFAVAPDGSLAFARPGADARNELSIGRLATP